MKEGSKIGISTEALPTEETPRVLVANVSPQNFSLDSFCSDRTGYTMKLEGANSSNGLVYLIVKTKPESEKFIEMINNLGDVTVENVLDKAQSLKEVRDAYEKLDQEQAAYVPEEALGKWDGAEKTLVEAVKQKINDIGEVDEANVLNRKTAIEEAREAYDKLYPPLVEQFPKDLEKKLTDAEALLAQVSGGGVSDAVAQAIAKINEIPSAVTYDKACKDAIDEARKAYDALSEGQKGQIPEGVLKKLTDAEAEYDRIAAEAVKEKIDAIGDVTVENAEEKGQEIEDARDAYDSLTDKQKEQISPETLKKLTDAEKAYDQATGGKNQAAVDRVVEKIDAIPMPVQHDWKCAQKIEEAREAYDSLTGIQKNLVPEDKKQKLTDAEKEYDRLAAEKVEGKSKLDDK